MHLQSRHTDHGGFSVVSGARTRLMSKAGGPVLIPLCPKKQPPQREVHLASPGFRPLSHQGSLLHPCPPPPHLSHSLQAHYHLHSSITATIRTGYSNKCMCVLTAACSTNKWGYESCFVFQVEMYPASTTSLVPALGAVEALTPAAPLSTASPCVPGHQLIQNSLVNQCQNLITI